MARASQKSPTSADRRTTERELLLRFVERQMEAGKWLLSSLLLVNGGAVVALLSNEKFGARVLSTSGSYFVVGVVSSFLAGAASWLLSDHAFYALRKQLGVKIFEDEKWHSNSWKAAISLIVIMQSLSVVSLGSFSYGAWLAANTVSTLAVSK